MGTKNEFTLPISILRIAMTQRAQVTTPHTVPSLFCAIWMTLEFAWTKNIFSWTE